MDKQEIIGYTTGVFDLFHIGHLNMLRNAKALCDRLIVGVTTDELLRVYKNKEPVIPFIERIEIVRNLEVVDVAIPQDNMDKFDGWKKIKYDVMFVGDDWYNSEKWNEFEEQFKAVSVKIIYFPYTKGTSSTTINDILTKRRKEIADQKI